MSQNIYDQLKEKIADVIEDELVCIKLFNQIDTYVGVINSEKLKNVDEELKEIRRCGMCRREKEKECFFKNGKLMKCCNKCRGYYSAGKGCNIEVVEKINERCVVCNRFLVENMVVYDELGNKKRNCGVCQYTNQKKIITFK